MVTFEEIDLTDIVAGTGVEGALGTTELGKVNSIQIVLNAVSASGLTLRMIQSNDGVNWFDVLEDPDDPLSVIEHVTTDTTTPVLLAAEELVVTKYVGIFVDRPGGATGTLNFSYNASA